MSDCDRLTFWLIFLLGTTAPVELAFGAVDFDRDVRPILSAHCYQCHGPDEKTREADLRVDVRAGLFAALKGGNHVVTPRDPEHSELYRRVSTSDVAERMPPQDDGKPLTAGQIETLRLWIEQGGTWRGRWSYESLVRPQLPVEHPDWESNPIDLFLRTKWNAAGVTPVPSADSATLVRRLSFDLTGLPPKEELSKCDLAGTEAGLYSKQVDQLLASPQYGERMAVYWLDLVRYADSCGYHSDVEQQVSAYRDYVIEAFNQNLPFDQFTREQLAGDLLPQPTTQQRVATGFNRLSKSTEEGGAQEGEYLAKAFADRVRTVSGTWLAATIGCAECHDHKYDPLTARDFYKLGAFFADVKERGVYSGGGGHAPELSLPTAAQTRELSRLDDQLIQTRERLRLAVAHESASGGEIEAEIKKLETQRKALENEIPRTLVTVSVTPREIRVLPRGDWLSQNGEVVEPGVPGVFPQPKVTDRRLTRLDLADWLVERDNPLTARVFVNRLWKMFFGSGLAKNLDDLGAQGEAPAHPELLDWLSVEFIESGWDVKQMIRLMVSSRAYRLSSVPTRELVQVDPQNRLFARQSRWRLEAEFLRDNALAVSGLLVDRIGGPSVKPYQPEGYWEFLNFPKRTWKPSTGPNQYRRGLYTHWQRTFLHPALLAFDASTREECTAARTPSNTPKSALALLNDPSFVEAARVFAEQIRKAGGSTDQARIEWAWRSALSRGPEPRELELLLRLLESNRAEGHIAEADVETMSWTAVARAILNLHEFTTRN